MRFTAEVSVRLKKNRQLDKLGAPRSVIHSPEASAGAPLYYPIGEHYMHRRVRLVYIVKVACAAPGRFRERCGACYYSSRLLAPPVIREGDMNSAGSLKGEGEKEHEAVSPRGHSKSNAHVGRLVPSGVPLAEYPQRTLLQLSRNKPKMGPYHIGCKDA
jgi:hypothetical protein